MIQVVCTLLSRAGLLGVSVNALDDPIRIESGTHGENCGAHHGNSTRALERRLRS
jgi:hypothetical protein